MSTHAVSADAPGVRLATVARTGDLVMMVTAFGQALAAAAIGRYFGDLGTALAWSAGLLAVSGLMFLTLRGTPMSCAILTSCNAAFVALHIQLGRGTIEFHFGVFVLLGLILVYRDWRPLVFAAALFAVHHVVFDRLQASGYAVYCTPQASFLKTCLHAIYVVAQTGVEVALAVGLRQAMRQQAELNAIVDRVDHGGALCLDVRSLAVKTPTALLLKSVITRMDGAMSEVRLAAGTIEQAAVDIAASHVDLSRRTEEQASNLQQTAASMEQLTGTVKHMADAASQAKAIAGSASNAAEEGGTAVGRIVETMSQISQSSNEIADIIGVIDDIAFQTNILALNAAVEAARAGEQGRGFAVVASEVRSLAKRSAQAAKEIKGLIGASASRVEAGTSLVGNAGGTMGNIVAQARRVSQLISEISNAAGEQTTGIGQVGEAVAKLDAVTQQNSALVEQGTAAAESLKHQAIQLNAVVRRFQRSDAAA